MSSAVGWLVVTAMWWTLAPAATPLSITAIDPDGKQTVLELTPPFERTLDAPPFTELHRLTLRVTADGPLHAHLVRAAAGAPVTTRSMQIGLPEPGDSVSFEVVLTPDTAVSEPDAAGAWQLHVAAHEDPEPPPPLHHAWTPTPHPSRSGPYVRVRSGGKLYRSADDPTPGAVWADNDRAMGAEVIGEQGSRVHVRRVAARDLCAWPSQAPQVQLEVWVERAELHPVLAEDVVQVHPDGTGQWLAAGTPVESSPTGHRTTLLDLDVPESATISDRFTPTLHQPATGSDTRVVGTTVYVAGTPLLSTGETLPVVARSVDGRLAEVVLPRHCGRAVVDRSAAREEGNGGVVGGAIGGSIGDDRRTLVPASTASTLTWPDGRPAGRLTPMPTPSAPTVFYDVHPGPQGRTCGTWRPSFGATMGSTVCWQKAPEQAEPPPRRRPQRRRPHTRTP